MLFLLHQNTEKSFCALVGAFYSASPPKHTKGNHLTLESESSPWAFHPCRVLRQLRREVSLSYLNPRRLVGGNPTLETAFLAQHLCFSLYKASSLIPHRAGGHSVLSSRLRSRRMYQMNEYEVFKVQVREPRSFSGKVPSYIEPTRKPFFLHQIRNFFEKISFATYG